MLGFGWVWGVGCGVNWACEGGLVGGSGGRLVVIRGCGLMVGVGMGWWLEWMWVA